MASPRAELPAIQPTRVAVAVVAIVPLAMAIGFVVTGLGAPTSQPADDAAGSFLDENDADSLAPLHRGGPDADGDGLSDAAERELGTDPLDADTDGDGFPDGMEVACRDRLPGADPLYEDVYVEVDSTADVALSADARSELERAFATAPVGNPNGETGIALHLDESDDDLPQADVVGNREGPGQYDDAADYREAHFDHEGAGYYYLVVVSNASYRGDPTFAGAGYNGTALVEQHTDPRTTSTLVMHELGHAFGIGHGWEGVDDDTHALAEYRSVMNYNGLYRVLSYGDGNGDVGRDEWAFVAEDRHLPALDCSVDGCGAPCS